MGKADHNSDPCDHLSAWLPSCVLQNGQNPQGSTKGRIYECNRYIDAVKKRFIHRLWEESIYDLLGPLATFVYFDNIHT